MSLLTNRLKRYKYKSNDIPRAVLFSEHNKDLFCLSQCGQGNYLCHSILISVCLFFPQVTDLQRQTHATICELTGYLRGKDVPPIPSNIRSLSIWHLECIKLGVCCLKKLPKMTSWGWLKHCFSSIQHHCQSMKEKSQKHEEQKR